MKKLLSFVISLVIAAVFAAIPAGAVGATTGEVDVVFLVDASTSMKKSDPDMIRLEAIKLFSDLCTLGSTKTGFVLFGADILYSQTPIPINTEQDRDALKKTVDGLTEVKGSTDIGRAVKHAADMLAADEYGTNGKFIVFLSDGKTVINPNSSGRTMEDSQADLEAGITVARDAGIPIYTIGLNASGDVMEDELNYISAQTYADKTYLTDSAVDLSEILSDIYVRHTGAESQSLDNYVSDGEYHDTPIPIADSTVIEANLVIMHTAKPEDIKLYNADGEQVIFDGTTADISWNPGYTLVKAYYPAVGNWRLSVKSPEETKVDINYILTRDYGLKMSFMTDKPVGEGTTVKFEAILTDPDSEPVTEGAVISVLVPRIIVTDTQSGEAVDVRLRQETGTPRYKGEYRLPASSEYMFQASFYNTNIDIRSDIVIVSAGEDGYLEPEGPLKLILIIAGAVLAVIVAIIIIIIYLGNHIKMWSGKLMVSVNIGGMPEPPAVYEFAKKIPGKRSVTLSQVMKTLFGGRSAEAAVPENLASSVKMSMTRRGDMRIPKVNGLEYSGGATLGKNIILPGANKLTLRCKDSTGSTNTVIILYQRT